MESTKQLYYEEETYSKTIKVKGLVQSKNVSKNSANIEKRFEARKELYDQGAKKVAASTNDPYSKSC